MNFKHTHTPQSCPCTNGQISHKRKREPVVSAWLSPDLRQWAERDGWKDIQWVKKVEVEEVSFSAHVALSNCEKEAMFLCSRHPGMPEIGEDWWPPSTESCWRPARFSKNHNEIWHFHWQIQVKGMYMDNNCMWNWSEQLCRLKKDL